MLPLHNLGGDPADDYLADGVVEDIVVMIEHVIMDETVGIMLIRVVMTGIREILDINNLLSNSNEHQELVYYVKKRDFVKDLKSPLAS